MLQKVQCNCGQDNPKEIICLPMTYICKKCLKDENKKAERIKELETYLKKYAKHKLNCAYHLGLQGHRIEKCDCGFEQALKG